MKQAFQDVEKPWVNHGFAGNAVGVGVSYATAPQGAMAYSASTLVGNRS